MRFEQHAGYTPQCRSGNNERSHRAKRAREAGKVPPKSNVEAYRRWLLTEGEGHLQWSREGFLDTLQDRIDEKDKPEKVRGGPYDRYILVIVTDEFTRNRHAVEAFLAGATFRPTMIDDMVLGFPYHPSSDEGGGSCPVFSLPLARGCVAAQDWHESRFDLL
jgi:hypothetical protein